MESLKNDEVKTNNDFNILLNKSNNIEKQIQNSKYSLNDYKSKLNIYIEMENHYEGFNKGVKEVLKNKNWAWPNSFSFRSCSVFPFCSVA